MLYSVIENNTAIVYSCYAFKPHRTLYIVWSNFYSSYKNNILCHIIRSLVCLTVGISLDLHGPIYLCWQGDCR